MGAGAGAPRAEGRGLGLPRGGRGRGGEGARGRGGESRILRGAAVEEAAPLRRWRRTDRSTAKGAQTDGRLPGGGSPARDSGGGRCAAPGPARAGAARGADRGRTASQHRAKEPAPCGGQCPQPPGPSGRARRVHRPPPGCGGGGGAGGFVLSRRQWGRGGRGLRDEGERERERGGRAWGSLCACVIESGCVVGVNVPEVVDEGRTVVCASLSESQCVSLRGCVSVCVWPCVHVRVTLRGCGSE